MDFERKSVQSRAAKMALELGRLIGESKIVDDVDMLAALAGDESHCEPVMPDIGVRVRTRDDVIAALELAAKYDVPVTPRGGGTGKAGGAIPVCGGAVLDLSRLNAIIDIDKANLIAVVQPGVVTGDFQQVVEDQGLFYPPDPNSWENCHLGGNVAHNAGGPRAFKYGVTREYVYGLEACLIGGGSTRVGRRTVKGVAGYDLTSLLVGSEGTLGVFTELTLRLRIKPAHIGTLLIGFPDELTAGAAVSKIVEGGLVPRVLEFMDGVLVDTLRGAGASGVPAGTGALLLAEVDGETDEIVEHDALKLAEFCEQAGADDVLMARHSGERDKLWAARRVLSDAVKERARHKISEDVVVPRDAIMMFLAALSKLRDKHGVMIASYGHAGDGNLHVNVLWDDERDVEPVVEDVFRTVLAMGGTITGEHGIGLAKKKYLPWEKDKRQLALYRQLKAAFDSKGLLNPGKIF